MFRVGMKVVCVDASDWAFGYGNEIRPVEGGLYTVRGFYRDCLGREMLYLAEIVNEVRLYTDGGVVTVEPSFRPRRFRPVVERKTDTGMAILKKLLQPKPERVE